MQTPEDQEPQQSQDRARKSGRKRQAPKRHTDYKPREQVTFESLATPEPEDGPQEEKLLALKALDDPDTLYLWGASKEPDFDQLQKVMQKEIDAHSEQKNWKLHRRAVIPKYAVMPVVWSMKWKRRISTREVYKWKANMNMDGSKQV
jgi:hypothetical protein